jgi:hypothetical protein
LGRKEEKKEKERKEREKKRRAAPHVLGWVRTIAAPTNLSRNPWEKAGVSFVLHKHL